MQRSPWKTRYFLDTEFTSFDDCQLISLAIVGEDGREFYAECSNFDLSLCSDFVKSTVLPQLGQFPGRAMPFLQIREELEKWLATIPAKPKPVLCVDFVGDLTLLNHVIDGDLPAGWKEELVAQRIDQERLSSYFAEHGGEHHALHDARANALAYR
ncbi:3'-5' exoribonuclease [Caballeronia sordidicola]|uniref:3'-5' exoribonuclease n=1 Tax=Caballeronia sordidicola TaxID=196367 RepID=UPI00094DAF8F|nr:3'-5' exoribonuclease [Caballeronia sordidicola]